jgi:hypothetical protein
VIKIINLYCIPPTKLNGGGKISKFLEIKIKDPDGKNHLLIAEPKQYDSGKKGYYAHGKPLIEGLKHQLTLNVVEITKKPKTKKEN